MLFFPVCKMCAQCTCTCWHGCVTFKLQRFTNFDKLFTYLANFNYLLVTEISHIDLKIQKNGGNNWNSWKMSTIYAAYMSHCHILMNEKKSEKQMKNKLA